ncbi:MAG: integrase arm-type DNA-binding domain-containing protein [Proteobacteria bacterium]|nr:integrase arm-type DNA-binding domain-containing protein [Pseudomonadota bacterium]
MAKALTTKGIDALKPDPERRVEVPDPSLSGLYLIVQPSGVKSWALRYRVAGRPAKLTLGRWPVMQLAAARAAASAAIEAVERGNDPGADKKATKAARRDAHLTERDKIKTLVGQFATRHLSGLRSGAHARQFLDRFVVKAWGDRDIHTITRRDVIDLLDGIADSGRGVTANRVLAHTRKFFAWCVERDVLAASPVAGVKPVAKEASRERVLSDDEIRLFWRACEGVGEPWGPLGKILLLTGQRLGEVAGMREAEVAGEVWHLPSDRTKNGRAHDVPLSAAARDVLAGKLRIAGEAGLIFTTTGTTPVSGYHKARNGIADAMAEIASKEAGKPVEIPHWTFHDLRRTAATGMARLGIAVRVTEAALNHVSGTGGGIVSVYQRHDYAEEKRQALEAWARFVLSLADGGSDNIVRLAHA